MLQLNDHQGSIHFQNRTSPQFSDSFTNALAHALQSVKIAVRITTEVLSVLSV
jgi:hypothetical protein